MAKHLNEWRPDTCGCVLEFFFDDEEDSTLVVHSWESTLKTCPVHTAITDGVSLYAAVLEENQRKNVAIGMIGTLVTVDREEIMNASSYSFDGSTPRVLTISFKHKIPAAEINGIQNAADLQFGSGLVVIER